MPGVVTDPVTYFAAPVLHAYSLFAVISDGSRKRILILLGEKICVLAHRFANVSDLDFSEAAAGGSLVQRPVWRRAPFEPFDTDKKGTS